MLGSPTVLTKAWQMTSINKLTTNPVINPGDLLVIWDSENQRTRSVSYDTLKNAVPNLKSAEYISPNLVLTQSNGEVITVAITNGGDIISGLLDGQVPVKDQSTGQLVYSGATVDPTTGQWIFDQTIEVPSSSLDVGEVVTISEGSTELLISNNIDGIVSAVISSAIDGTGAKSPSYFKFGAEKSFLPQPYDSEVITTNPLIAKSTGRVVSPNVRQINQTIFKADKDMPNTVAEIKDKASGKAIKYIPSRAAWDAKTADDRARNPGLNFIAGDNVIDYVSREEDTPGIFNIGVSPFRLTEGQEFEIIIKADVMALKGINGVPYLAEMVQDGPEVFLVSEDDQYIDEIIAGNNVVIDNTNPKKPVITASSGGSASVGILFAGIYKDLQALKDAVSSPTPNMQAIVLSPSEKYYHGVGGSWVDLAPVGSFHPEYVGTYSTVQAMESGNPSAVVGALGIVGTDPDYTFYVKESSGWIELKGDNLAGLTGRVSALETKFATFEGDHPKFDPSMFQSAVDHGYAADDQGIKSAKTTDGWWIFKDLKSISGRPAGSIGDLLVFKNEVSPNNVALKHVFLMAIGQDKGLENKVWFQYRDDTSWTPWLDQVGADVATITSIRADIVKLKTGNADLVNQVSLLNSTLGNIYAPTKLAFNKAVTSLISAALANYTPVKPGHGGDKPSLVFPRFYAQFSLNVPTDFAGATTSTNAEATLLRIPTARERIFISVENDNGEASKVTGFKFNNKQEMSLDHRDIVRNGKKYRAFYTSGAFSEQKVDIKVDFGQGI